MTIKDDHFSLERNVVVINAFFHYFYGYIDFGFPFIPLSYMGYFFYARNCLVFLHCPDFFVSFFSVIFAHYYCKTNAKNRLP